MIYNTLVKIWCDNYLNKFSRHGNILNGTCFCNNNKSTTRNWSGKKCKKSHPEPRLLSSGVTAGCMSGRRPQRSYHRPLAGITCTIRTVTITHYVHRDAICLEISPSRSYFSVEFYSSSSNCHSFFCPTCNSFPHVRCGQLGDFFFLTFALRRWLSAWCTIRDPIVQINPTIGFFFVIASWSCRSSEIFVYLLLPTWRHAAYLDINDFNWLLFIITWMEINNCLICGLGFIIITPDR